MSVSGSDIVTKAKTALGVKYVWGGDDLYNGIDCSGLVQQVYRAFGIDVPRVTYDQIGVGSSVPIDKLQPGDLVFFDTDKSREGPDHVGIYIGGGKFIHAPRTGDVVKISSLTDSYYMNRWMGGRRIPGVQSGYGTVDDVMSSAADSQPRLDAAALAETYGLSYAFFKSQPQLMGLLKDAVAEQWGPDVFQAQLRNTDWWKENSDSVRKAKYLAAGDPATYKANLAAAQAAAEQAAVKAGAILSDKALQQVAKNMVDFAWNDAQVMNFLGQYVGFTENHTLGGQAGQAASQITKYAYDNGLQISDQTVKNSAAYLVRGLTSMQEIRDGLLAQAMSTYPGWQQQLAAGATMRDVAQPYIQMTSQELGLPESDIDVWHPKVRAALQARDAKGQPAPMGLADFATSLRTDPAWAKTPNAQSQAMQIGRQVLSSMGLVG